MIMPEQRRSGWETGMHHALIQDKRLIGVAAALSLVATHIEYDVGVVSDTLAKVGQDHGAGPDDINAALIHHEFDLRAGGPMHWREYER